VTRRTAIVISFCLKINTLNWSFNIFVLALTE
jgi:hypothetical protein